MLLHMTEKEIIGKRWYDWETPKDER